jgi:tRNA splicing ligase
MIDDIKPGEDYLIISNMDKAFNFDRDFFNELREKRSKLPINVRALISDSDTEEGKKFKKYENNFNLKSRFLPKGTDLTTNLVITPQRVLVHQFDEPITAIAIENKSTIKMNKEFFEIMWNVAEGK